MARLALLLLVFWSGFPAPGWSREVPLTILHTTDVHGHILPTRDYEGHERVGGLLRCATLIESIRAAERNVLLVDCGDTVQGGAESYLTGGQATLKALEWLRYDAWTLGNHEFDWGLKALRELHDASTIPMLGANIYARAGRPNPLSKVRPYVICTVDGIRVALVGLTTPGIPNWTRPEYLGDIRFRGSVETLARIMPEVRAEKPEVMVLLLHQGHREFGDDFANEVNAVARRFPEFDAILGGHTHVVQPSVQVGEVLYSQAGYYANWLGRLDLVYDTVARRVVEKNADVLLVGDDYAEHPELKALLHDELDSAETYLAEEVGACAHAITASRKLPGQSGIQQLLSRAIHEAVDVDVVLHGILDDEDLAAGPVTREDVWRIVPYENRIGIARLTPAELKEILLENAGHAGKFSFMGVYGLSYTLRPRDQVDGVTDLRLANGKRPHPRKRLRVAMNSYVLASGGRRFLRLREIAERPTSQLKLTRKETRTAVERYMRRHVPLTVEPGTQVTVERRP